MNKKERFINEEVLVRALPAFPHFPEECITPIQKEVHLEKIIDLIEETLILKKAEEIKKQRNNDER